MTKLTDVLTKKQVTMIKTYNIKFTVSKTGFYIAADKLQREGRGRSPRLALEALLASA